jgi:hypothetical protein
MAEKSDAASSEQSGQAAHEHIEAGAGSCHGFL